MRPRRLLLAVLLFGARGLAAQVTQAPGQELAPKNCRMQFRGDETRTNLVKLPSGKYNAYQGGGVTYSCEGQGNQLRADSAEYYGEPGILYMIGNVHYTEPRMKADAAKMTYFQADDHLLAEGNVVAVMNSGTTMRGPRVEYWRTTPVRPRARLVAPMRPHMQLVEADSTGKPQEPTNVVADLITMDGDSLVYGSGKVEITRTDLFARGDSIFLDSGREFGRLMRNPMIESRDPDSARTAAAARSGQKAPAARPGTRKAPKDSAARNFTLVGETIDLYSRQRRLQRVVSMKHAVAQSEDMRLSSDTVDLRVAENKLERAYAWGPSRAHVVSPERDIVADSLDVIMPAQRLREVRALKNAFAQTAVDTAKIRTSEKDWLRGDTIIARFDTALATDSSKSPRARDVVASGNASSYYHMAPKNPQSTLPSINYARGRVITVELNDRQVRTVTVLDQATGMYLEPAVDTTQSRKATVAGPRLQKGQTAADAQDAPGTGGLQGRTQGTAPVEKGRKTKTPPAKPATPVAPAPKTSPDSGSRP